MLTIQSNGIEISTHFVGSSVSLKSAAVTGSLAISMYTISRCFSFSGGSSCTYFDGICEKRINTLSEGRFLRVLSCKNIIKKFKIKFPCMK